MTDRLARALLFVAVLFLSKTAFLQPVPSNKKAVPPVAAIVDAQDTFPVPAVPNQLFYLQRTSNTNTVIYEAKLNNKGQIEDDPVHVFWIRYPEGGVKKELNYIQRVFAYGIKTEKQPDGNYKMHVVSYKKQQFSLRRSAKDGRYHAYTIINKKEALLKRVFVKIGDGGTFWAPNILYMELRGRDENTGEEMMERFKP